MCQLKIGSRKYGQSIAEFQQHVTFKAQKAIKKGYTFEHDDDFQHILQLLQPNEHIISIYPCKRIHSLPSTPLVSNKL